MKDIVQIDSLVHSFGRGENRRDVLRGFLSQLQQVK